IADDVADIDADAELNPLVGCNLGIALKHPALDIHRAAHRVDNADKFHQHTVAGGLDDAAAVLGDLRIDQLLAVHLQLAQRAFLVGAHQAAIAGNIGGHDRGKSPVYAVFRHLLVPRPLKKRVGWAMRPWCRLAMNLRRLMGATSLAGTITYHT